MAEWKKRMDGFTDYTRRLVGVGGQASTRLARQAGGKWLPSTMRRMAGGLAGASRGLETGAKRLQKKAKRFGARRRRVFPG